jgi:hypothetical protein
MPHSNSKDPKGFDNCHRPPSTDAPETITLGGMTLRRISNEEGEASFWRNEAIIAQKLGIPFDTPEEADSTQSESNPSSTSVSPSLNATNPSNPATPSALPVPPGLSRCPVCNEYRGTIGIDDQSIYSERKGDFLTVQCICDGILCRRCKNNRIHRPISNVWDERGGFGHIPYFAAMASCNECRAKKEAEEADRKNKAPATRTDEETPKEKSK